MEIIVVANPGYCWGVKRSIDLVTAAAAKHKDVQTLGPVIHNMKALDHLKENLGVSIAEDIKEAHGEALVIRAHGATPEQLQEVKDKGLELIDGTCPFVTRSQKLAKKLVDEGYYLVIIGSRNHPEVIAILAHAGNEGTIIETVNDVKDIPKKRKIGIVVQSTKNIADVQEKLPRIIEKGHEFKFFNTICDAVEKRQQDTLELAEKVDVMLIVGDNRSANTKRLARLVADSGVTTYHVETGDDIKSEWFTAKDKIGISMGTSTPDFVLENVVNRLEEINNQL